MLPTQRPPSHPTPVVRLTFCSSESCATLALALLCAALHALPKSGTGPPRAGACSGEGGLEGSVSTKTPEMGESDGTGKGVNDTGAMGMVMMPATHRSQHDNSGTTTRQRSAVRRSARRTRAARSHAYVMIGLTVHACKRRDEGEQATPVEMGDRERDRGRAYSCANVEYFTHRSLCPFRC